MLHPDREKKTHFLHNYRCPFLSRLSAPTVPSLTEGQGNTWPYHCCYRGDAAAAGLQQPLCSASPGADAFNVPHAAAASHSISHTHARKTHHLSTIISPDPRSNPCGHARTQRGTKAFHSFLSTKICRERGRTEDYNSSI